MKYICPLITVQDILKARDFYENVLGQKVKFDFGENVTYHGDFAIHQIAHFRSLIENKEVISKNNSFELYFENDEIEKLKIALENYGVEFIHNIREQPWRQKVMRFYDPDGNIIEVGESFEHLSYRLFLEGITISRISEITYLPEEVISSFIEKYQK